MAAPPLFEPRTSLPEARRQRSRPLSEFRCFSKLPIELRLEIWNLTMLPRAVDIYIRQIGSLDTIDWPLAELYSNTPVPISLQVCRESRSEALRVYQLCFGTHMVSSDSVDGLFGFVRSPRTYFSYTMDVANFMCDGKLERKLPVEYMRQVDIANIRHIRVDWCVQVSERLVRHISCFEKLESLTLTWHWREMISLGLYDGISWPDVEVTEKNYQMLQRRPDIFQFMEAFITARDVFAPGLKIPLLRVKSINNHELMDDLLKVVNLFLPPRTTC